MKNQIKQTLLLISVLFINIVIAQEENNAESHTNKTQDEHHEFKKHSLVFELGYTHIPDGYEDEAGDHDIWVPTLGIAYTYYFNHKWGAGLTVNMETDSYLIEFNKAELHRENVFIIAALAKYEIVPNWGVFLGPGIEIEEHHNFGVIRIGTEYAIPLKKNWMLSPILTFDHKTEYTSWEIAVGIGKKF
jgi:hypothetical protein